MKYNFNWLNGWWQADEPLAARGDTNITDHWVQDADGTMRGRLYAERDGDLKFWEMNWIEEVDGVPHFFKTKDGGKPDIAPLTSYADTPDGPVAIFEPTLPFPKQVIYKRQGEKIRLELTDQNDNALIVVNFHPIANGDAIPDDWKQLQLLEGSLD